MVIHVVDGLMEKTSMYFIAFVIRDPRSSPLNVDRSIWSATARILPKRYRDFDSFRQVPQYIPPLYVFHSIDYKLWYTQVLKFSASTGNIYYPWLDSTG